MSHYLTVKMNLWHVCFPSQNSVFQAILEQGLGVYRDHGELAKGGLYLPILFWKKGKKILIGVILYQLASLSEDYTGIFWCQHSHWTCEKHADSCQVTKYS